MRTLAQRFNAQNDLGGVVLTAEEQDIIRRYADHHAGGLVVLWRSLTDDLSVKLHDSWGEDGPVVVHVYDADDPDRDYIEEFADGHEAIARFLSIDESVLP